MRQIVCYLLIDGKSPTYRSRSYRGYTVDLPMRLKRHRGLLSGGARYTKKFHHCDVLAYISGFQCKRICQSFEWFTKKRRVRSFSQLSRKCTYRHIVARFCGTLTVSKFQDIVPTLTIHLSKNYCNTDTFDEIRIMYPQCIVKHEDFNVSLRL